MSSPSWLTKLRQTIQRRSIRDHLPRIAVVGIGHELNGDDAAGLVAVRALSERMAGHVRVLVLDAGPAPENQTGRLRTFGPDLVLFIDAAHMGAEPGTVRWIAWQDTTGISASSHTLPPYVLAQFLTADLGCEVALLGVQPAQNAFDAPLSDVVSAAITQIVDELAAALVP